MTLTVQARVGKKYAIYLPKVIVKALNLQEGQRVLLRVAGSTVTIQGVQDPLELAISGEKFAKLSPEEIEEISLEEQTRAAKAAT